MKKMYMVFAALVLASAAFATTNLLSGTSSAISSLCTSVTGLLPVAAMLMIVLAGVIYASGQIMGAETRARANVWATACLTGALIAVLITVIAPTVLGVMNNGSAIEC